MAEELTFIDDAAGQPQDGVSTPSNDLVFVEDEQQAQKDQELEYIKGDVARNVVATMTRTSPEFVDKAARFVSGSLDLLKSGIVDFPKQVGYWAASKFYEDTELDEPEERKALMNQVADVARIINPFSGIVEKAAEVSDEYAKPLVDQHEGKDYEQLFAEGNITEGADALVGDVASALPSVAAAFTGWGGLALLGASSAGGKFEERFKEGDYTESENQMFANALYSGAGELASEYVTNRLFFGLGKVAGLGKKPIQNAIAPFFPSSFPSIFIT